MKKSIMIIPITVAVIAAISIPWYYHLELTKPVCIEGSFPNGTCQGPILIESGSTSIVPPSISWSGYDRFLPQMMNITGDQIIEKRVEDPSQLVFTTQKGNLIIRKDNVDNYSVMIDYSLKGTRIPKSDADFFVNSFMKSIDYRLDGTEKIDRTDYGTHYRIAISQKNHGWIIQNHMVQFEFWQDDDPVVYIRLGKWYNDLPKIELKTDQDDAKKIAYAYLMLESKKDPDIVRLNQTVGEPGWVQMEMVNDRLVYVVAGNGFPVNVMVDPVSGSVVGWKMPQRMD